MNDLNEETFMIYAIKCYNNLNCILTELEEDLNRIKYVKRLIRKYRLTGKIKERLILNHIIILGNVFGVEAATRMLFYKIDEKDFYILKTFLLFLNYLPTVIKGIKGQTINSRDIKIDVFLAKRLRDSVVNN